MTFLSSLILCCSSDVLACPICRRQVQATIYAPDYAANLFMMLLPILIIFFVSLFFYYPNRLKIKLLK